MHRQLHFSHPYKGLRLSTALLFLLCLTPLTLCAQATRRGTLTFQDYEREYYITLPAADAPSVAEGQNPPLILCLHGYGGHAENACPPLAEAAAAAGWAVCCPQGLNDPTGNPGWNVRYPSQTGMEVDDVAFMLHLAAVLPEQYGLDAGNVFFTGMSNGGEMCYLMAYTHPEAFRAIASIAGLQMEWIMREHPTPSVVVPFMEVHGTADTVSYWEGDPTNQYGWGRYLAVPVAVSHIVTQNRCTHYEATALPLLHPDVPSHPVVLHHSLPTSPDGAEVLLYEVQGGNHSWSFDDLDTIAAVLDFFSRHLAR